MIFQQEEVPSLVRILLLQLWSKTIEFQIELTTILTIDDDDDKLI